MIKHALFVRLEAKPGKEQEVSQFLQTGLGMAQQEGTTPVWFALQLGPSTFGIFDAFADEAGRQAHLKGPIAQALGANASRLLAQAPTIERIDVLGTKLPGTSNQQTPEASATGVAMNLEVHVIPCPPSSGPSSSTSAWVGGSTMMWPRQRRSESSSSRPRARPWHRCE